MRSRWPVLAAAVALAVAFASLGDPRPALAQADAPAINAEIDGEYGPRMQPALYHEDYSAGVEGDFLIDLLHYFMFALFGGWAIFFVYCLLKFRARPGHRADPTLLKAKPSKYLEVGIAVFEAVLLLGLSIPVWADVKTKFPPEEEATRVRVVAEQFQWNFHYPGPDGKFGRTAPDLVDTAINPLGLDEDDPNSEDDLYAQELHFPAQKPVIAELTSKDVIHSFFLPVLRVKQDTIPGMRIPVWFRAREDVSGNYEVACAQLCGNNHYSMRALMTIHSNEDEFLAWYQTKWDEANEEFDEEEFD